MEWFLANIGMISELAGMHLFQAVVPLVFSVLIAVPLAQVAKQNKVLRTFILGFGSILYTVPSLALFVMLPVILGTKILDIANVMVALTIYAVALLVRVSLDAFDSVDEASKQSAIALGYGEIHRFFSVDLPLSLPVLFSGLRVVSVSNISLVTIGALLGTPSFGTLFMDGLSRNFPQEILIGIVGTLLLALILDVVLVQMQALLTPWLRTTKRKKKPSTLLSATQVSK